MIERQLNEYLEGRLSNLSPELSVQCSSAPVHNMFAERTLALSDFHLRRASNVQIGFVDGIVKSKINGTMAWQSQKEQDTVIAFSIRQAQRVKMLCKQHKAHMANIQQKRHVEKKKRKMQVLEGNLRQNSSPFLKERLHDLYNEFPDLTRDQANTISKALSSPCTINELYFAHMWFIADE